MARERLTLSTTSQRINFLPRTLLMEESSPASAPSQEQPDSKKPKREDKRRSERTGQPQPTTIPEDDFTHLHPEIVKILWED